MSLHFKCPMCGKLLTAAETAAGQTRTCPQCRAKVKVPMGEAAAQAQPERAASDHAVLLMKSGGKHPEDLIDMTAMVDIVFFLLIFFMVTSIQALESVIGLPTPQTSSAAPAAQVVPDYANDPSYITVAIESDDTVWVNDEQVFGPQDLRVKLRSLQEGQFRPTGMMVLGNPDASHGTLVMVLDAGADSGLEDLRFSVTESTEGDGG
jgi:biopolymer transport protein ExbD